ncbi:O-antigen ligase family protein [Plantactinospora siamensis]|uniref:O-antigen ligase family protein n=1 Tax=Plantactinospora siamensis TaxID=555372 RepID=A0ABV6P6B0_9ACTN
MSDRHPVRPARPAGTPAPVRELPLWPLTLMFGLVPLWWAVGAFYLGWSAFGVLLLTLLVVRGRVALPAGTALFLIFLALAALSFTRLERTTAYLSSGLRWGHLGTALVVCVYVYNLARDGVPWERVLRPLALFWLGVVALGWLAVLLPTLSLPSPTEAALPAGVAGQRFMQAITHLRLNEFNPVSRNPIYRTAAPFPYTNNWGTAYALLVPFILAYLSAARRGPFRTLLLVSLPASVVPAFFTLNRGMFLGLGFGLLVLAIRALVRGNARLIASIGGVVVLIWIVSLVVPVQDMINARVSSTDTNVDRMDLYVRTWAAVRESPLLGYGAPRTVDTTIAEDPLGTQGLLWQVLYSYGIPAMAAVLGWLVWVAIRLGRAVSTAGQWLSIIPLIALVVIPVYSYIDPNLSVLCYAVGVGLAAVDGPVNRTLRAAGPPRRPTAPAGPAGPLRPPPAGWPAPGGSGAVAPGPAATRSGTAVAGSGTDAGGSVPPSADSRPVVATAGPVVAASGSVVADSGPVVAVSGPVAVSGSVVAASGSVVADSGPVVAVSGPVAVSGSVVAASGPVVAASGPGNGRSAPRRVPDQVGGSTEEAR